MVGDDKPFVGAMISLDPEMLPLWLANKGLPVVDPVTAAGMEEVQESLRKAIEKANSHVSRAESIRRFGMIDTPFTVENGYLTPSLKLRRNLVLDNFAEQIEGIYNGAGTDVAS